MSKMKNVSLYFSEAEDMLTMSLLSTVALTLLFCILSHLSNVHCAKLFPFGNKSVRVPDEDIKKIRLSRPLNFFEKKYNELYVSFCSCELYFGGFKKDRVAFEILSQIRALLYYTF